MNRKEIKEDLRKRLTPHRFEHTLGVEYTACCLAMRYGADMEKADLAGLLHDCAKQLTSEEKIQKALHYGMEITDLHRENPELLHAGLGAYVARERYGIEDEEILSAITWHTTGRPDMTLMEKILYIADYIEPNRYKQENLFTVRELAFKDLDECLIKILEDTVAYLESRKIATDPMTRKTYEFYQI